MTVVTTAVTAGAETPELVTEVLLFPTAEEAVTETSECGLRVVLVTGEEDEAFAAATDEEGRALLTLMGMPFRK